MLCAVAGSFVIRAIFYCVKSVYTFLGAIMNKEFGDTDGNRSHQLFIPWVTECQSTQHDITSTITRSSHLSKAEAQLVPPLKKKKKKEIMFSARHSSYRIPLEKGVRGLVSFSSTRDCMMKMKCSGDGYNISTDLRKWNVQGMVII